MSYAVSTRIRRNTQHSDGLDAVDGGKVFPPLQNDKLDHDVRRWLLDAYALGLLLSTVSWQFAGLSDCFEAVAVGGLASFD